MTIDTDDQLALTLVRRLPGDRPFTSHEADERGVTNHDRRLLVAAGLLRRPMRGVFCAADLEDTLEQRVAALRLVVPPDCVVTDRSAAWLWGAQMVLAPNDHLSTPAVSVFAPPGRRLRNGLTASGERMLRGSDVTEVAGLQVTTPLRTTCDVARLLHMDQAIGVMDAIAALETFTVPQLVREIERFKGYRGVRQARVLCPIVDGRADSPGVSVLRLRWYAAGLPRPECQVEIEAPQGSYFLDIGNRRHRMAAEYDGEEFHGEEQRAHDEARRAWARGHGGWTIYVARRHNVHGRQQDAERELRRIFQELPPPDGDPSEMR